jgi:hypothetical protein
VSAGVASIAAVVSTSQTFRREKQRIKPPR